MNTNQVFSIVNKFETASGNLQGILQVPFYLGMALAITSTGHSSSSAIQDVLFYAFGLPRALSIILEVLGGMLSYKLGEAGSFDTIPIGQIFRSLSLLLFGATCISTNYNNIIILGVIGVFLAEIGRSLQSGSLESAFQQSFQYIDPTNFKDHIKQCNSDKVIKRLSSRIITAIVSTFIVLIGFQKSHSILILIPFLVSFIFNISILPSLASWNKWAKGHLNLCRLNYNSSLLDQTKVYFKSFDFLWSLGIGGFVFFLIYSVSMSPLSMTNFIDQHSKNNIDFFDIILIVFLSGLSPLAALIGNKISFKASSKINTYQKLTRKRTFLILLLWSLSISFLFTIDIEPILTPLLILIIGGIFAPIRTWSNWMKLSITSNTSANFSKGGDFGKNQSFYLSLIEGGIESTLGIISAIIKILSIEKGFTPFYFSIAIISFLSLLVWSRGKKLSQIRKL